MSMNENLASELKRTAVQQVTRRRFLQTCQVGLGAMALGQISGTGPFEGKSATAGEKNVEGENRTTLPMHAPSATNVIYIHQSGSAPALDLYDYKPELIKHNMQPCPRELLDGKSFAFIKGTPKLLGTPLKFAQHGECGAWFSEAIPNLAQHADELCFVKSMQTDQFNHAPAQLLLHTGNPQFGGASMGAWATYGLGSENANLPGYMVMVSGGTMPSGGKALWGSSYLPSVFQGVQCRGEGDPILYVSNPDGMDRNIRRRSLDALNRLNQMELERFSDPETLTRIQQYELTYRMQTAVPEIMDISRETAATIDAYGAKPGQASFANNCLLARRLVEQGVRFVQLFDWGWDIHGTSKDNDIDHGMVGKCAETDRPIAALLTDLKQRGVLENTLVICGGEFGRTPMNEARNGSKFLGRDHHPDCFTIWMAGGGVKPGLTYGTTDELGYKVADNPVPVRDFQATILHALGFDPHKLSFPFQGLNQRLIGPANTPKVRSELLA